ncbi:ubiquitin-activating enzyme E1 [Necator americanus]|uniref:Ubiquitin-activating enzyme E1 n=1 Tax=Necator americanus TaxID=51031 RepID=W2TNK2_NECAM|nr:ubiquitin-activating enzyme E1 [Necator americanus]ETN83338.1 ubiquitin-activating enzyme E1 [Necator americanus]
MSTILAELSSADVSASAPPTKKARVVELSDCPKESTIVLKNSNSNSQSKRMASEKNGQEAMDTDTGGLDTNLYSRQIYALGESAMIHLRKASVLISGLGGVGVEIAKNLILGGVRSVTLHDTKNTRWFDLSAQYYLTEGDLGKNRAAASFERLAELNDSVNCQLVVDRLTEDFVKQFDLVILTDTPRSEQLQVASWTRAHNRYLLLADARGLYSYIFADLGNSFRIDDPNGEQIKEFLIEYVDAETGDVTTLENQMHGLEDGDYVTFSEVKGMTELNGCAPLKITVKKDAEINFAYLEPHVFNIGEAAKNLSQYEEGGRVKQVKVPTFVSHKTLEESLADPEFVYWDFAKFDYPSQLHLLWGALYKFEAKHGRHPNPRSDSDVRLLKVELPDGAEVNEKLLKLFSYQASGNLVTIASIVGGIAAQEAMKAVTHHMTPLKQWLYLDCDDALPGNWSEFDNEKLSEEDCKPVISWIHFLTKYPGAIGCELLKNLAMMGVACGEGGLIKITDMDQIEISNLNRQFLFRMNDVGSKKSVVAGRAVKFFNKDVHIEALSERVGPDTEHIFNDDFFAELDGVANALDNIDARRYMDRRCVFYRLPLLESGTMGTKGNTQVVYPYLTESYGSSVDPPEKDIPICTLKNFPNEIQHTIQWARDLFEGLFTGPVETANQFLADERAFLERLEQMNVSQRTQLLSQVKDVLIDSKPSNAEDCIKWARLLFQEHYHDNIAQMLHSFPADQVTDQGAKFWSGTKRCPHVLDFDPSQEEHRNFVYAASILRAQVYGIKPILDIDLVMKIASSVQPPPFRPRAGVKIAVTEAEAKENAEAEDANADGALEQVKVKLARLNTKSIQKLNPIDFEKDDDTNHHMEMITAASNLRAENYSIQPADRMKTKQIAGRIIPAIATTTATVAGLVCIELYKMVGSDGLPKTPMTRFKNGFINLALPFFGFSEPIAAPVKKYNETTFTLWDRLEIQGPKTLQEAVDWIQNETGLEVTMLSSGVSLIYSFFMDAKKRAHRMPMDVKAVVEDVSKREVPRHQRSLVLEVMATDPNTDEDVEVPYIRYVL